MGKNKYNQLNLLQKAAVRHAHPASFIMNLLGVIWAGYFLWLHQWVWAMLCLVAGVLGDVVFASLDRGYLILAKSQLNAFQKLLVYHTHPVNLILHLIGLVCYVLGAWYHAVSLLLAAVSFVLLGHVFPWLSHKKEERLFALMIDEDVSERDDED
jgi:hypothetical protein